MTLADARDALDVLRNTEAFERIDIPALDETVTVVDHLGMYGTTGVVGATPSGRHYLLLEDVEPDTPPIRVDLWNGASYDVQLRVQRLKRLPEGQDVVYTIPNAASTQAETVIEEASRETSAETDGGQTPGRLLRELEADDEVVVHAGEDELPATISDVDDEPDIMSELLSDALHVTAKTDDGTIRLKSYSTVTRGMPVHLEKKRGQGNDIDWKFVGPVDKLEVTD